MFKWLLTRCGAAVLSIPIIPALEDYLAVLSSTQVALQRHRHIGIILGCPFVEILLVGK